MENTELHSFIELLYPEIPEGLCLVLWAARRNGDGLTDKATTWIREASEVEACAGQLSEQGREVYFGVGLTREFQGSAGKAKHSRAKNKDIRGLYGFAADLDVVSPGHKKGALFPNREAVVPFVKALPMHPTVWVWTGGGYQVHWVFKEPWLFESEEERQACEAMSRGWNAFLRGLAKQQGVEIDATWDLARVLRIPGTVNHKYNVPVELETVDPARRYNPADFEAWRLEAPARATTVGDLSLDPQASPPFEKFMDLSEIEPRFVATFKHKRKDMKDSSPSAHDMSLANFAAQAGWADQEIVDLLIAHRREHKLDLKLRADYYRRTLTKVRESITAQQVADEGLVDASRAELLTFIRTHTALDIQKIIKYGQETPQYVLMLDTEDVVLIGGVRNFLSPLGWEVASALADLSDFTKPHKTAWPQVKSAALKLCETVRTPETDRKGVLMEWLQGLVEEALSVESSKARFEAIKAHRCFTEEGRLYFRLPYLREHLAKKKIPTVLADLQRRLAELGLQSKNRSARHGKKVTTQRYYSVSLDDLKPKD